MYRKYSSFMLLLFFTLSALTSILTGCSAFQKPSGESNLFDLAVIQNTDTSISGIHYEYFIADEACGGCEMYNADQSLIRTGEVLYPSFTASDFPKGSDLSLFSIQLFIIDETGSEFPAGAPLEISVAKDFRYEVSLEGNADDGFKAILK